MKNIIISFVGLGSGKINQAKIKIWNQNRDVIFDGYTCNGQICLPLDIHTIYYIKAVNRYGKLINTFYLNKEQNKIVLVFPYCYINTYDNENSHLVTFTLIDQNYLMPISKGGIYLWQN